MASCRQLQQVSSLLVATCCFLLLICTTGQLAARPEPRSVSIDHKKHLLQVSSDHGGGKATAVGAATVFHVEKLQGKGMEQEEADMLEEYHEEECLMRRTLVAHTDYIYTQGKHN